MLKVALVDLDAVKSRFPDTKTFIDDTLNEVIFYKFRSKELALKNMFLDLCYSDYFLLIGVEMCDR